MRPDPGRRVECVHPEVIARRTTGIGRDRQLVAAHVADCSGEAADDRKLCWEVETTSIEIGPHRVPRNRTQGRPGPRRRDEFEYPEVIARRTGRIGCDRQFGFPVAVKIAGNCKLGWESKAAAVEVSPHGMSGYRAQVLPCS